MMAATEIKAHVERDGFVQLPGFFSHADMDHLHEELARFIATILPSLPPEHVFYEDKSRPESLKQIQQLYAYDPYFEELMLDSPFRHVAESILNGPVVPKNMQYFNKAPGYSKPTPPPPGRLLFQFEPLRSGDLVVCSGCGG